MDERLGKIADLDKNINPDNLIYKYKGNSADGKFYKFDNALDIIHKIKNGEISLANVKNNQAEFRSYLGETRRENKKKRSKEQKKTLCTILKCFTKQETGLLNFMMIILQWSLKQKLKQLKEQDLKYSLLKKCFEDYQ